LALPIKRLEEAELGLAPALSMVQNITIAYAFFGYSKELLTHEGVKAITISGSVLPDEVSLTRFAAHRGSRLVEGRGFRLSQRLDRNMGQNGASR
jgi:hypothetical protein